MTEETNNDEHLNLQNITFVDSKINETNLTELDNYLQKPDSILEENVFEIVKNYLRLGGSPSQVIQNLSNSYRGYPQMCNLISNWMEILGMTPDEISEIILTQMKDLIISNFDVQKADQIFYSGQVRLKLVNYYELKNFKILVSSKLV